MGYITCSYEKKAVEPVTTDYSLGFDNRFFTPQPLRAVGVLFSPMVSGWAGGRSAGNSLSGLYLRNHKV